MYKWYVGRIINTMGHFITEIEKWKKIIWFQFTAEYFQGRIAKDINDMAGHIINTMNNSKNE